VSPHPPISHLRVPVSPYLPIYFLVLTFHYRKIRY
jgi:hypothetical protein